MRHRAPTSTARLPTAVIVALSSALVSLLAPTGATAATALANLEPGVRDEIVRRCLPTQYREGADAYRNCVTEGVAAREDGARGGGDNRLDALAFDDRYAIERACANDGNERCVTDQLQALDGAPDPFLDGLGEDERHAVRRQCFAVQGEGGVAAYRRCLDGALATLDALPEPDLGALSLVERNALALRCSAAPDAAAADYRLCLLEATGDSGTALGGAAAPDLAADPDDAADGPAATAGLAGTGERPDSLPDDSTDDAAAGEAGDEPDGRADGLAALPLDTDAPDGAGAEAVTLPPADEATAALATEDRARDEDGTIEPDGTVVRRLVLPAGALPDEPDDAAAPLDDEPVITAQEAEDTAAPVPEGGDAFGATNEAGETGTTRTPADEGAGTSPAADPDAPPLDMRERAVEARERLAATVTSLDDTQRIVFGAALALPLLLLGIWAASRGGARSRPLAVESAPPIRNTGLVDRVSPPLDHDLSMDPDDTGGERFLGDLDLDDLPPPATGGYGAPMAPASAPARDPVGADAPDADGRAVAATPTAARWGTPDAPTSDESIRDGSDEDVPGVGEETTDAPVFAPRSDFGRRLLADETPLSRQHAIEFLIYWMAYADERYEPETRAAVLREGGDDGDPHDLIKRHVLEEDALAFADAVRRLQRGTRELQRMQILDLLMVLLISERAMTPAQNTLLHFLADAFGLGAKVLDERHEEAFGMPMPALARPDLAAWWAQVEPDRPLRWDARAVAGLDERQQFRIRLGLPLDGEIGENEIVEGFRRAARRCHPHRFDELGERERALAERQFAKFEEARDRLLGVNR